LKKKLTVLGVDPGATVGYALLDLNGNTICVGSRRNLSISNLVLKIIEYGKVVVVGCDVSPPPRFVKEVSKRLNAMLIYPQKNLTIKEKKRLVRLKKKEPKNRHERDALASAIFALKRIKHLLEKIDTALKKKYDIKVADEVKEIILTKKGLTIERAFKTIKKKK